MKLKSYLPAKQPLVYRTFQYALQTGRLAHAYLLVGEAGTPLKETAIYLAKTLLCDNPSPLADEACRTCSRMSFSCSLILASSLRFACSRIFCCSLALAISLAFAFSAAVMGLFACGLEEGFAPCFTGLLKGLF